MGVRRPGSKTVENADDDDDDEDCDWSPTKLLPKLLVLRRPFDDEFKFKLPKISLLLQSLLLQSLLLFVLLSGGGREGEEGIDIERPTMASSPIVLPTMAFSD